MIRNIAAALLLLGVVLMLISMVYAKKINLKKVRKEYQNITTGKRIASDYQAENLEKSRQSAWRLYDEAKSFSRPGVHKEPRELTDKERGLAERVDERLEKEVTGKLCSCEQKQPDKERYWDKDTAFLQQRMGKTEPLGTEMNEDGWNTDTLVLDEMTEILIEED